MIRPSTAATVTGAGATSNNKSGVTQAAAATTASPTKQSANSANHQQATTTTPSTPSTIREIRSRTTTSGGGSSFGSSHARHQQHQQHLLGTRRQAASMERLNGGATHNATSSSSSMNNINNLASSDKESAKCSPINGSSQSINNAGSAASSPSRGSSASSAAGLNRTASRVSRFRSAKAVFERLSSSNSNSSGALSSKLERSSSTIERPRGTVASRYAAAAVARSIAAQQQQQQNALTSARSRLVGTHNNKSPVRTTTISNAQDHKSFPSSAATTTTTTTTTSSNSSATGTTITSNSKSLASNVNFSPSKHGNTTTTSQHAHAPRPQPRVIAPTSTAPRRANTMAASQSTTPTTRVHESPSKTRAAAAAAAASAQAVKSTTSQQNQREQNLSTTNAPAAAAATTAAKPPPRDLIDKIVLEIARDADKEHDANCTIQDLSNCDISGIPETLDFDKCFQDVEMMTEEEARKLLSRKSGSSGNGEPVSSLPVQTSSSDTTSEDAQKLQQPTLPAVGASSQSNDQAHTAKTHQDHPELPLFSPTEAAAAATTETIEIPVKQESQTAVAGQQVLFPRQAASAAQDQTDTWLVVGAGAQLDSTPRADSLVPSTPPVKNGVRFSHEPATIFDTYAPSDYDRRNDDIDPVAASAEYEIEKSREREGLQDDDDDDDDDEEEAEDEYDIGVQEAMMSSHDRVEAVNEKFNNGAAAGVVGATHQVVKITCGDSRGATHTLRSALRPGGDGPSPGLDGAPTTTSGDRSCQHQHHPARGPTTGSDSYDDSKLSSGLKAGDAADEEDEDQAGARRDYIESLEREVSLKRILEQNLRDLQSQYYETVKQLDSHKGGAEAKISRLEQSLAELNNRHECAQGELSDAREQSSQLEKQLTDIRESSQLLEKKYHRAKRIIKDMQSREESFTRREQLYQQKLDEIEHELSVLISTIDQTIYDDGLKFFSLTTSSSPGDSTTTTTTSAGESCPRQHQARLDVFGLIRQMSENFKKSSLPTQSVQIKQRIVSMLEQQLAELLALSNGATSVCGPIVATAQPISLTQGTLPPQTAHADPASDHQRQGANFNNNNDESAIVKRNQSGGGSNSGNNYPYASHRLSQPNMPHPIGVGGQPTKIFHGLNSMPMSGSLNVEPSPPQSVNSYPSTNSLNSLTNNNSNNNNNNNNQQTINHNLNAMISAGTKFSEQSQSAGILADSTGHHLASSLGALQTTSAAAAAAATGSDDNFRHQALADTQVPYQSNEWHNKPVSEWTTNQVSTWLLALGLDQYISKFEDRNVNGQSLLNLDSTVLKGLGVLNSNDRNLLKKKIRELRVEMEKERKIIERKIKENLKEKSKMQAVPSTGGQSSQKSWKKSLLS